MPPRTPIATMVPAKRRAITFTTRRSITWRVATTGTAAPTRPSAPYQSGGAMAAFAYTTHRQNPHRPHLRLESSALSSWVASNALPARTARVSTSSTCKRARLLMAGHIINRVAARMPTFSITTRRTPHAWAPPATARSLVGLWAVSQTPRCGAVSSRIAASICSSKATASSRQRERSTSFGSIAERTARRSHKAHTQPFRTRRRLCLRYRLRRHLLLNLPRHRQRRRRHHRRPRHRARHPHRRRPRHPRPRRPRPRCRRPLRRRRSQSMCTSTLRPSRPPPPSPPSKLWPAQLVLSPQHRSMIRWSAVAATAHHRPQ